MKQSIATCLVLAVLISSNAVSWATTMSIKSDNVCIRSGPGTDCPVLYQAFKGYPVRVLSSRGNWARVTDFENDTGWVYRPLLLKTRTVITTHDGVNVRSGPGLRYGIRAKADYGTVFRVLRKQGNWVKVRDCQGITGWIHRKLLFGD